MAKNLAITVSAVWLMACAGASSDSQSPSNNQGGGTTKDSRIKIPGSCVDPLVDGDLHDQTRTFEEHVHVDVHAIDLDDDGDTDFFVVSPQCTTTCVRSAYVARAGSCGFYVGTFNSTSEFFAKESKHEGLKDLVIHPREQEDNVQHCYEARLEFNGKKYVEKARRECECKPPGEDAKCESWK
jgi:hypothetical protein